MVPPYQINLLRTVQSDLIETGKNDTYFLTERDAVFPEDEYRRCHYGVVDGRYLNCMSLRVLGIVSPVLYMTAFSAMINADISAGVIAISLR